MPFVKYQHVERFGTEETEGIDLGVCYVFPKLDGTNASIWLSESGEVCAGSRNRKLTLEKDNGGFLSWVNANKDQFQAFFDEYPHMRLYGEWLIPHTLKTYREDSWRRFWIFDVTDKSLDEKRKPKEGESNLHYPYENYYLKLDKYKLDHIEPLCTISDPTREQLDKVLNSNTYLIQDGSGAGEGIVIKNYEYQNPYGRQTWAKLVRNEFKEKNKRAFGVTEISGAAQVEGMIAEEYITPAFVAKTQAKIELEIQNEDRQVERKELIPRLLQTCYHELISEEIWHIIKKYKNPTIDFGRLQRHVIHHIKKNAKELF